MRWQLKLLLLISALGLMAEGVFGPLYAVFVEQIGGDLLTAGYAYSAFAVSAGVLMFFISRFEDHVKHQGRLLIAGNGLASIGMLGYLFITKPWHLFLVQVILGLAVAIGTPAFDGLYSGYLEKGKFISQWGTWESMRWVVTALAAAFGGMVATLFGFRSLFIFMFFVSFAALIISTSLADEPEKHLRIA